MSAHFLPKLMLVFLLACPVAMAGNSSYPRQYQFTLGQAKELQTIAANGVLLNSLSYDLYYKGISPHLSPSVDPYFAPVWSVFWTFNFTMWPHDGGHWARANQAGGDFRINAYRFPFPDAEMIPPPENASEGEKTLTSAGGFEINNLMSMQTRIDFYQHGYAYADRLIHSFIQSLLFPLYTLAIAQADTENPDTWTETVGDPVEYTAAVYRHHSGRDEIRADGSVDPALVDLYQEIFWANIVWTLLDPMLYQSARAFAVDMKKDPRYLTPWVFGNETFGWHYSTMFNPSALGYELYLYNMIRIEKQFIVFYAKWGRPFKNRGFGLMFPEFYARHRFSIGIAVDVWDQDIYGKGSSIALQPRIKINKNWQLSADLSWKDDGYLLGRRLERSYRVLGNLTYSLY